MEVARTHVLPATRNKKQIHQSIQIEVKKDINYELWNVLPLLFVDWVLHAYDIGERQVVKAADVVDKQKGYAVSLF